MVSNDTIFISASQYKVLINEKDVLDIEIKKENNNLIDEIMNISKPIFRIELGTGYIIAKGNNIFSSSVPQECDYFYPLHNDNKPVLSNKRVLNLRKI